MALEPVTFITDFVDTNPTDSDPRTEGNEHIQRLKTGIQGTFANFTGIAMTATEAELNTLDGVNPTLTAAELNILDGVTATAAELNYNDITTLGTWQAGKTLTSAVTTGNIDCNNLNMSNIDIDSGAIDGATLGSSANVVVSGATMTLGSDADGDTYYRSSGSLTRLAKGTASQVLQMNAGATAPEWSSIDNFSSAVSTASGTPPTTVISSIPSTANIVVVAFNELSFTGTSEPLIQVGHSAGTFLTTGYSTSVTQGVATSAVTTGFQLVRAGAAAETYSGIFTLIHIGSNLWVGSGTINDTTAASEASICGGIINMGANVLDALQLNDVGTGNFDGGSVRAYYR